MKRFKKILFLALMVAALSCLFCQPAFAISEEEVQAQVDAVGKEAVSDNVLIWFMCAIGFLKVSQKIDSFMASLGVNVGHTGGSMLAEAMIAAKGIGGFKNFSSHHFGGGRSSNSTPVSYTHLDVYKRQQHRLRKSAPVQKRLVRKNLCRGAVGFQMAFVKDQQPFSPAPGKIHVVGCHHQRQSPLRQHCQILFQ